MFEFVNDNGFKFAWALLIVVMLVVITGVLLGIFGKKESMSANEAYVGYGSPSTFQSVVSGPSQRFGSEFTGTNQGAIPDNLAAARQRAKVSTALFGRERMTSFRESPNYSGGPIEWGRAVEMPKDSMDETAITNEYIEDALAAKAQGLK
jgi:hypothetical protein